MKEMKYMKKLVAITVIITLLGLTGFVFATKPNEKPLKLGSIGLGDSQEKVLNTLGDNYREKFKDDISGYIGEDYYIWYYDKGIEVTIGERSKEVLAVTITSPEIITSIDTQVGDLAREEMKKNIVNYEVFVDIHSKEAVPGWFKPSDDTLLIFDFDKSDKTRVNTKITDDTKIEAIHIDYLKHFD